MNLREAFPQYTDEQLKDADENLGRYVELVLRIYDRVQSDPKLYADFKRLTDGSFKATFKGEQSQQIHLPPT